MTKGKQKKQRLARGQSLYNSKLVARAKELITLIQPIKADGTLHYGKLAKVLGIPTSTFSNWRNRESQYYKPKFAEAIEQAFDDLEELIHLRKTKRAMIARSQPYNRIKKTKDLMTVGPKMPILSKLRKQGLQVAAKKLCIKVDKKMTVKDLKLVIVTAVQEQTEKKLVVVKQEEERMHGDVAAGKMVTSNIGPKDKRWIDQTKVEVTGQSLADIAAIMYGKEKET